jgi:peptide/nickel transport system substrate-binding protein
MKHTPSRLLAITSAALLLVAAAHGRTRPRYGDGVRGQTRTIVSEYEGAPELLSGTVFETLFEADGTGRLVPKLATTWLPLNDNRRWELTLRENVRLHDGSALTPTIVAKSLIQSGVPGCKVLVAPNAIVLECDVPQLNLASLLAQPKYLIATTAKDGHAVGTGPYKIERRELGRFTLKVNDDYWGTRPYLDSIEIATGRTARDEMTDFSLDRAEIIDVPTDLVRRMQQERARLDVSRLSETVFLVINSQKPELRDLRLRQAISLAIDRASIQSVIFQRQGEVAVGLLPNWLTGYAFLFPSSQDTAKAQQLRQEFGSAPPIAIAYDANDPLERLIAERVALNVREAGINMSAIPKNGSAADIRIQRLALSSADAAVALNNIVERLSIMPPASSPTLESLYNNERAALQTFTAIPLVHLPRIAAIKDRVRNWSTGPTGDWNFNDIWVSQRSVVRTEGRP